MRISLLRRLLSPLLPLILVAAIVIGIAYRSLTGSTNELMTAVKLVEHGIQAQSFAIEMSDAMKGFLIEPSNIGEKQRKIRADERLDQLLDEIRGRTRSQEMIVALDRLHEAHEKELDPFENEIVALIEQGNSKLALERFQKEYAARRVNYDTAVKEILAVARTEAQKEAAGVEAGMKRAFLSIVISLLVGVLAIAGYLGWIAVSLSRRLSALTQSFTSEAESVTKAAHQILESSHSLAQAVSQQSAALQQTVASVEEINAMVSRNAANAKKSQETVDASRQKFDAGKTSIKQMVASMEEIRQSNDQIVGQIERNNAEISDIVNVISEIGSKTKVINDIVFQTKLLSFNASVEAARAGEHGKGFAVVAEEVGNLAQMSGNAAKEISGMLETSIQKVQEIMGRRSGEAAEMVSTTKRTLEAGTSSTQRCSEAFDSMAGNAGEVGTLMQDITNASTEQAQGLAEVNKAMGQLDQVTQANNTVAQNARSLAEGLTRQAGNLRGMTQELSKLIQGESLKLTPKVRPAPQAPKSQNTSKDAKRARLLEKARAEASPKPAAAPASADEPALAAAPKKPRPTGKQALAKEAPAMATGAPTVPSADDHRFIDL